MKNCLISVCIAMLMQGALYSACHKYSLPTNCVVSFVSENRTVRTDYLDVIASVDDNGQDVSPFRISVCDGKVRREFVLGKSFAGTKSANAFNFSGIYAVRGELISDGFKIEDDHFRISANKIGEVFQVVVDNLDARRLDAELRAESERIKKECQAFDASDWPRTDGGYRYCCSRGNHFPIVLTEGGETTRGGWLRSKGALYQREGNFLIRFVFSHEGTNGLVVAHSEGHITGEIVNREVKNCIVTFDVGKDVVGVHAGLSPTAMNIPHYDVLQQELGKRGMENCTLRVQLDYGVRTINLDFDVEFNSAVRTISGQES